MTFSGNSEIQQIVSETLANRPHSRIQRADTSVTAVITVEQDLRFLPYTLEALLRQSILPSTIVIADCSGKTTQSVETSFEISAQSENSYQQTNASQKISLQIVKVAQAKSFGDAFTKALRNAQIDTSTKMVWLLHDDSRPSNDTCLEALLDAWNNTPTAALLGAKQLDWEGNNLHDVGFYMDHHQVVSLVVDGEPDQEQYDARSDVYAVSLAGALIPMNTLAAVRGVNSWFTTYEESKDFCRRLCRNGKRVIVVPQAKIAHRRARFEGIREKDGQIVPDNEVIDSSMAQLSAAQKYQFTDMNALWWPLIWIAGLFLACGHAIRALFHKRPYRAWCYLCMPWIALFNIPSALSARHRVKSVTTVSRRQLSALSVDRRQIRQWKSRVEAFHDQREDTVLNPLAAQHLRMRLIRRWVCALIAAVLALVYICVMYWHILRYAFSDASLLSAQLLPTDASFGQLVSAATTPWNYGIGTGIPVPPTPWLLVLMLFSVITGGHVSVALALIFFLSAPISVLSFWALAGIFTRSDAVRVIAALLWLSCALAFGLYSTANLPMLTVMMFLPAALALSFKAVGMYRTEQPVNPRSSIQAAAGAALAFVPVVAAEPQLLLALIVIFAAFLVFVRHHRLRLLLIPLPAAFALAPTLVNTVRYGKEGLWRQLFGDIMIPTESVNAEPHVMNLSTLFWRVFGLEQPSSWGTWPTQHVLTDVLILVPMLLIVLVAIIALFRISLFRASRILWTVSLCGLLLATVSSAVAIAVMPYGPAGGSLLPGIALAACGIICSCSLMAGSAVKPFLQLAQKGMSGFSISHVGRILIALLLTCATATGFWYGWTIAERDEVAITGSGLPMVATDYLAQASDRRILALSAASDNTVDYTVMRTGRGDLIDSSPAYRVSAAYGLQHGTDEEEIARLSAQLLANSTDEAIETLSNLGFGGIYVVTDGTNNMSAKASEQLLANITASRGTQAVVSNTEGTYFRLTLQSAATQHIDVTEQKQVEHGLWRSAWLWCLSIILVLYCIVAIPRRNSQFKED